MSADEEHENCMKEQLHDDYEVASRFNTVGCRKQKAVRKGLPAQRWRSFT